MSFGEVSDTDYYQPTTIDLSIDNVELGCQRLKMKRVMSPLKIGGLPEYAAGSLGFFFIDQRMRFEYATVLEEKVNGTLQKRCYN